MGTVGTSVTPRAEDPHICLPLVTDSCIRQMMQRQPTFASLTILAYCASFVKEFLAEGSPLGGG